MRSRLLDWYDRLIDRLASRIADRIADQQRAGVPTMTYHVHIGDHDATPRLAEHVAAARRHMHHHR